MSLLEVVADKPFVAVEENPETASLFEFRPNRAEETEQDVRDQIHERFGLVLVNPSTIEPDKFNQAYRHFLPEGFTFNPEIVECIRVFCDENETEFAIKPKTDTGLSVFMFRVSHNHSNHALIPPELLSVEQTAKMAA